MEFFKKQTNINFMGQQKWAALLSALLCIASIVSLFVHGLNWGLDFTGGTQLQIRYTQAADLNDIRESLTKTGFDRSVVQNYGSSGEVLISLPPQKAISQEQLTQKIMAVLPDGEVQRVDSVGPEVGQELMTKGVLAVVVALIAIMIYVSLRFEYRFAVSAAVALIHDPILILGVFSYFQLEFNLTALAAVLTVIGYSINDTIVIFDRVRENFLKMRKGTPLEIMNSSINQTLSRTIMTSGTTLLVVVALFIYGGEMLHGFALAMMIGIVIGTYSSIYVAGALSVAMGLTRKDLMPTPKEDVDDRP
jgi:preprotein translocase subunit SecF